MQTFQFFSTNQLQTKLKYFMLVIALVMVFSSCEQKITELIAEEEEELSYDSFDNLNLPETPFNYSDIALPAHFQRMQVTATDNELSNQVTDAGATLGRVLFYDKSFSANNSISCASCHQQASGFSDPLQFSDGFDGGKTGRNSMGLSNARYYTNGHFFWDERAETLEDQVLMPIQDPVEMGMDLNDLVEKIQEMDHYPFLFEQAFGDDEITSDRISLALAQFVRSIVSFESPYDEGITTVTDPLNDFDNFTELENQGKALFFGRAGCRRCHQTDLFVLPEARNIGLELVYADNGLGDVTGDAADNGKFKAPSLRNIELTAPFMHDGRFATLREVVEHYNSGIQDHPNLAPQLKPGGNVQRLNLTEGEKDALVAFLQTLTDLECINDEKFSDPFQ